jgi:8-oxo-dGTP pyrophosphatase MutT (NUDIX family)
MQPFSVAIDERSRLTFAPASAPPSPVHFAVMMAQYSGTSLLVYNRLKMCWELPGGWVEEGETAHEAAERELLEEAGQRALNVYFLGRLEVAAQTQEANLLGALFCCDIEVLRPFTPNEEIAELALWHGQEHVGLHYVGVVSDIDRRLLALYKSGPSVGRKLNGD